MRQRATAPISHASPALGKNTTATKVRATFAPPLSPFSYADLAAGESIGIVLGSRARGHTGQKGGLGFHVIKRPPLRALPRSNGGAVSGVPHRDRWRGCSRAGQDNPLVAMLSRTGQTGGSDSVSTTTPLAFGGAGSDGGRWAASVVLCNPHCASWRGKPWSKPSTCGSASGLGSRFGLHVDHGAPGASVQSSGLGRGLASMSPDGTTCWAASTLSRLSRAKGRQARVR